MNKKMLLGIFAISLFSVSCSDKNNDEPTPPATSKGELLIQTVITNDGQSGSSYVQLLNNADKQEVTNRNAYQVGFGVTPFVYKNWVFSFPSYFGSDASELKKFVRENGELKKSATMALPENSQATNMAILNENKAYLGLTGLGKIIVFNPTTMTKISEIDLNSYGDPNPEPSGMIIRDNQLFITLGQWAGATWFPAEKSVEVLVVNTQTDAVEKHIKETASGLSFPTNPGDLLAMDENKNIYVFCLGAFGQAPGFDGGILRIKNGETDFDPSFVIKFSETNIAGALGKALFLKGARYAANGIIYAYAYIDEYQPNQGASPFAMAAVAVKIDTNTKTISRLTEIPVTNGLSASIVKYKDKYFFGNTNNTQKGFYSFDPITEKASTEPVIKVEGYPQFIYSFE